MTRKIKIDHDVCIKFIEELNELMCQETGQIPFGYKYAASDFYDIMNQEITYDADICFDPNFIDEAIPYTKKEKREEIRKFMIKGIARYRKDLNVIIKQLKQMEVKT